MGQFSAFDGQRTRFQHHGKLLARVADAPYDLERTALEMMSRFDEASAWIARELAEVADKLSDRLSAKRWRDIASAIEQIETQLSS
jgi:hypothetical protein